MNDSSTTVADLRQMVGKFVSERRWEKFHSPKNISMAMSIEAAELMEHFQWVSIDESCQMKLDIEKRAAIGEELADVLCYGLAMANALGIDVSEAMRNKMAKNREKYPVERYLGKFE